MTGMQMAMLGSADGPRVTLNSASITDNNFVPTAAIATFSLNNSKTVTASNTSIADWLNGAGTVGNYESRATLVSGTFTSGSSGVWENLGVSRAWSKNKGGGSAGAVFVTFTLEIRDAGTLAVLATATIDLNAEVF